MSDHLLAEFERTLEEPYFAHYLTPSQRAADIALICAEAIHTPITAHVHGVATHPEDDLTLATTVSARAGYLVTGDQQLRRRGIYQGVRTVSPPEFLEDLADEAPAGEGPAGEA